MGKSVCHLICLGSNGVSGAGKTRATRRNVTMAGARTIWANPKGVKFPVAQVKLEYDGISRKLG